MAKSEDRPEKDKNVEPTAEPTPAASEPAAVRQQVQIDDTKALASYANFCRVTGTPEELIIDFGLNPQPFGIPTQPIPITQRLITNFYTAKRMLHARDVDHPASRGDVRSAGDRRAEAGHARGDASTAKPAAAVVPGADDSPRLLARRA